jgi:aspartate/tyrosine/aromatic aminotransferase
LPKDFEKMTDRELEKEYRVVIIKAVNDAGYEVEDDDWDDVISVIEEDDWTPMFDPKYIHFHF